MAESIQAKLDVKLTSTLQNPLTLTTPTEFLPFSLTSAFTGATRHFGKQISIDASATTLLDLNAPDTADSLGEAYDLTSVSLLIFQNVSGNDVLVKLAINTVDSTPWTDGLLGMDASYIQLHDGETIISISSGLTVGGTSKLLEIINTDATHAATVNVFLIGSE